MKNQLPSNIAQSQSDDSCPIVGKTTIYGQCLMVDSENLTAIIKLLDDSILTVQIATNQIAEDLNLKINQIVGLCGIANWNTLLKIERFQTESISPFSELNENGEKRTILECLEGLSSKIWDEVDPDKFIQTLRD